MRSTGADRAGAARAIVLAAVLASLGRPGLVRADEAASSAALAQQLYDDAKAAMAKGDYPTACQKFAESHRLDAATGGTLLNLAVCHEKMGRTATAWGEFEEAAQLARHFLRADREALAREHIEKLRPLVSMLSVRVPEDTVLSTEALRIQLDGMVIGHAAWGNVPVDPGDHILRAEAPHKLPWTRHLAIGTARETLVVEVPVLVDEPHVAPATDVVWSADLARSASSHRATGFLLGGIGTAGIAIGSAFGLAAIHLNGQSKTNCSSKPGVCPPDPEGSQALVDANISNVAFGVGILGLALGTYFIATAPSKPASAASSPSSPSPTGWRSVRITPEVGTHGGSVGMGSTW
jgi:hypothetical protein